MTDTPAPGVDQWAMQHSEAVRVPQVAQYGEREHITMQVRNAPNGQRATRQVATNNVHHFDVQAFPAAVHINLYSDTSAGWLFMRREIAERLFRALGIALKHDPYRFAEALEKIAEHDGRDPVNGSYDEWSEAAAFRACQDIASIALGRTVTAEIDTSKPPEHSETNDSELHGPF